MTADHAPQVKAAEREPGARKKQSGVTSAVQGVLASKGTPLSSGVRGQMEAAFGHNFGAIRIHAGPSVDDAAARLGAAAFTIGSHIAVAGSRADPTSVEGERTLRHELAHAVQQGLGDRPAGSLVIGSSHDGNEREAERAASDERATTLIGLGATLPRIQRQDAPGRDTTVDIDLEVPPEADRDRLRQQGIDLPRVSAAAADPRLHSSFVERSFESVAYGIYLGGFLVICRGLSLPIFVSESYLDLALTNARAVGPEIYGDRPDAMAVVPYGPPAPGQPMPFAYHRVPGTDVIVPTIFSPATTPNVVATLLAAQRELARQVQQELTILALSLVGGMILKWGAGRLIRWSRGGGRVGSAGGPGAARARATELARAARARGEPVVANLGGAGSANEPAGAININNQAVPRAGIPNLVQVDAAEIGQLFPAGSVDRVEGYRMAPGAVDWGRGAPGAYRVLRPGGTFRYSYQGANADAQVLGNALRAAGFRNVEVTSDVLVTAVK